MASFHSINSNPLIAPKTNLNTGHNSNPTVLPTVCQLSNKSSFDLPSQLVVDPSLPSNVVNTIGPDDFQRNQEDEEDDEGSDEEEITTQEKKQGKKQGYQAKKQGKKEEAKLKLDDLVTPKFVSEIIGSQVDSHAVVYADDVVYANIIAKLAIDDHIRTLLLKVKIFNHYNANIKALSGVSRVDIEAAIIAINPPVAPFIYGYSLPGLKYFLISSAVKIIPYMCRGCNEKVQYFVGDPLPIHLCLICGIGACPTCSNNESSVTKISLCPGCEDNLHSKCTLPDNFYIKKVSNTKPNNKYPANDIRARLPSHISEGPITSTQAVGSLPTIALGQDSQYSEVKITQPCKQKRGNESIDSSQFGDFGLNGWDLLSQVPLTGSSTYS